MSTLEPRPHQVEALADLVRAFAVHDRAQLVMACGTGKTLVARWHAEASDAREVLVLVPSLALLAQTLREWRRAGRWRFDALVVCSDPTTAAGAAERADGDQPGCDPSWSDAQAAVTTDPAAAARFFRRAVDRPRVVFSTYHSAPVVAAAQAASGVVFDLAVCDEAHRLAGQPSEAFRTVLNPRAVVARRRLFMTATPRSTGGDGHSMDDPRLFGPVAHTVDFGAAIRAGLLCDYRVLVVADRSAPPAEPAAGTEGPAQPALGTDQVVPAALVDAADRHGVRRVLAFHGRVADAAAFARAVDGARTSRWATGHRIRWQWDKPETQWRLGYAALRQHTAREGHAAPATSHREQLPDARVNLGQWVALQRLEHRRGELAARRVELLDLLPGWQWDGDVGGALAAQEPLELPGGLQHGRAGAVAHGCHCEDCLQYRRGQGRSYLARRRANAVAGGVDARPARRHLEHLEQVLGRALAEQHREKGRAGPGAGRTLIAAASGVPLGIIRQVAAGAPTLRRKYDAVLRATSAESCLSHRGAGGSRGRGSVVGERRVDAAATWALVRELDSRGFTLGWIGRELGYARSLQLDSERVTRRVADQVRDLTRRVADLDLRVPPGPRNRTLPTLAELRAGAKEVA